MEQTKKFVITINRQLGSGGSYIGQKLAKRLDIFYADREIITKVAEQYSVLEEELESHDEKILSFWQSIFQYNTFSTESTEVFTPPKYLVPKGRNLFLAEAEIIKHIANERSAVIIGRCGSHILRDYPNHISMFIHADIAFRNNRIQKLHSKSEEEAGKMITKSDKERTLYCKKYTEKEWTDVRNYDLSIDTSKINLDKCVELILNYMKLI